ncbi:MAG: phosphoribosyltransferase family protein, partial [Patescibacteria group bacterium]
EAARRERLYRGANPAPFLAGKVVIIADDGVATGLTMRFAIMRVRAQGPAHIVVAVPVIPADFAGMLEEEGVVVAAVERPEHFLGAVGAYYEQFDQVSDEEVRAAMASL